MARSHSLVVPNAVSNAERRFATLNPKGWAAFQAQPRYHSFMQNNYHADQPHDIYSALLNRKSDSSSGDKPLPTDPTMQPIIEVRNLIKKFGDLRAVDNISFSIPSGICFGLLGPNGAGKTTTIEIIEGIKKPDSGEILYQGASRDARFKLDIGIQFQSTALMDFVTTREALELFSRFYDDPMPVQDLAELCQLGDFLNTFATRLSGGQKQRLLLAIALINNPRLLFLDEPTTGLDPQSRRNFWQLIERIKQQGKTILLTTHYMDEAERLCDHLLIVDHGKVIAEGSPQKLLQQHFEHSYVCLNEQDLPSDNNMLKEKTIRSNGLVEVETDSVERTLKQLISMDISLSSLRVRNPTLDDLFLKLTGHHLRD